MFLSCFLFAFDVNVFCHLYPHVKVLLYIRKSGSAAWLPVRTGGQQCTCFISFFSNCLIYVASSFLGQLQRTLFPILGFFLSSNGGFDHVSTDLMVWGVMPCFLCYRLSCILRLRSVSSMETFIAGLMVAGVYMMTRPSECLAARPMV